VVPLVSGPHARVWCAGLSELADGADRAVDGRLLCTLARSPRAPGGRLRVVAADPHESGTRGWRGTKCEEAANRRRAAE